MPIPNSLWQNPLVFPAYLGALSILYNVSALVWRSRSAQSAIAKETDPIPITIFSKIYANIASHGLVLFALRSLRSVSCIALAVLSLVVSIESAHPAPGTSGVTEGQYVLEVWIGVVQTVFYVSMHHTTRTASYLPHVVGIGLCLLAFAFDFGSRSSDSPINPASHQRVTSCSLGYIRIP